MQFVLPPLYIIIPRLLAFPDFSLEPNYSTSSRSTDNAATRVLDRSLFFCKAHGWKRWQGLLYVARRSLETVSKPRKCTWHRRAPCAERLHQCHDGQVRREEVCTYILQHFSTLLMLRHTHTPRATNCRRSRMTHDQRSREPNHPRR